MGGFHYPLDCASRHKVAIVIPFRNRDWHLAVLVDHLLPVLKRQQLAFQIYVVELVAGAQFNRGMLINIGFVEALKEYEWDCFVFHDVDLLPENDHILYSCPESPRHLSAAVNTMNYELPYSRIFGGVSAFKRSHFKEVNGFSNRYFHWGSEDDDLYDRTEAQGLRVIRFPTAISRYTMLSHAYAPDKVEGVKWDRSGIKRRHWDGINSLRYEVVQIVKEKLFTRVVVKIDEALVMSLDEKDALPPQPYR